MFDHRHYVPILKAKRGEFVALRQLTAPQSQLLTPLLEVPPFDEDGDSDALLRMLDGKLKLLEDAWKDRGRVFVDLIQVDDDAVVPDGRHALKYLVEEARARGIEAVPTTSLGRSPAHQAAVADLHASFNCGLCLRVDAMEEIHEPDFLSDLDALLDELGVEQKDDVDFLLDCGSIYGMPGPVLTATMRAAVLAVPQVADWRTLSIAAGAFPVNMVPFTAGAVGRTPRTAWSSWNAMITGRLPRVPTFGDYGISHPDYPTLDAALMRPSATLKYTADDEWVLLRGRSVRGRRYGGFGQFQTHCQQLIAMPEYCGRNFSWGDEYIDDCAQGNASTGNLETWVRVGVNHHLVKATSQCSAVP